MMIIQHVTQESVLHKRQTLIILIIGRRNGLRKQASHSSGASNSSPTSGDDISVQQIDM